MDAGGIDQISKLLQRMREERNQGKAAVLSKDRPPIGRQKHAQDLMDEEDEEGDIMPSRYIRDPVPQLEEAEYEESSEELSALSQEEDTPAFPEKPQSRGFQARAASAKRLSPDPEPSSSEDEVEDPRQKLSKRMDELRARRQMLGPPARVQPEVEKSIEKPEECEEEPETDRPKTALPRTTIIKSFGHKVAGPSFIMTPAKKPKKTDPVSLYQQRQKEWQKNKFLKANKENAKEGRKLKLAENSRKPNFFVVHEKPQVPKVQYVAPHEKRRDDLRFQTRVTFTQVKMANPADLKRPQTAKS